MDRARAFGVQFGEVKDAGFLLNILQETSDHYNTEENAFRQTLSKTLTSRIVQELDIVKNCLQRLGPIALKLLQKYQNKGKSVFILTSSAAGPLLDWTILSLLALQGQFPNYSVEGFCCWANHSKDQIIIKNAVVNWVFATDPLPIDENFDVIVKWKNGKFISRSTNETPLCCYYMSNKVYPT